MFFSLEKFIQVDEYIGIIVSIDTDRLCEKTLGNKQASMWQKDR